MEFSKLTDYLNRQDDTVVVVTFHKIGEIIGLGDRLPKEYYEQARKGFLDGEEISDAIKKAGYKINRIHYEDINTYVALVREESYIQAEKYDQGYNLVIEPAEELEILEKPVGEPVKPNLLKLAKNRDDIVSLSIANSVDVERKMSESAQYQPRAEKKYEEHILKGDWGTKESTRDVVRQLRTDSGIRIANDIVDKLVDYIVDHNNKFYDDLEKGNLELPEKLAKYAVKKPGRDLKTLVTIICKYLEEFVFHKDNFYVFERVLITMLPRYLSSYGVDEKLWVGKKVGDLTYKEYYDIVHALHHARNNIHHGTLTKGELVHIIWYAYK
jgi:hypothetical protein